jgi:L-alanine-DL-glutamate epimerase-like enolase superfamily enzyme
MLLEGVNMKTGRQIVRIDGATLVGTRPRPAGANARLPAHGGTVQVPLVRLTLDDGTTGFGRTRSTPNDLARLIGAHLDDAFEAPTQDQCGGVRQDWRGAEFALWDALGQATGLATWRLVARYAGVDEPLEASVVRCYDTSLYFDDLHVNSHEAGAALIADEARQGWDRGHRAFKMKVGRGARHMAPDAGLARDIAAIREVRAAVGPDCPLMIDANNGYTLNQAKHVLGETAASSLFWLEEAFHEDPVLYRDLREWLDREKLICLIADGEGLAASPLLEWAREGIVQVVQFDIFSHGLTEWVRLGQQLAAWGVRAAPHHYGAHLGNYVTGHLAPAAPTLAFVEWDECATPGIETSAYVVDHGTVRLPDTPGFGLHLDDEAFAIAVAAGGFTLRA